MVTQPKRLKLEQQGASFDNLSWDHPVQLIGEKVNDPDLLNCCMLCCLPILVYGRMHPCKHVLCLDCAKKHCTSSCSKCGEKVTRVEQCQLGTVFVCSFGSPRHGPGGCRRTYLSYRDMEAHVKHRHAKKESSHPSAIPTQQPISAMSQPPPNLNNPPPQFMRPPNSSFPPPGHMVNRPPPSMAPTTNVPPPGMPVVSHPHRPPVHHVPQNPVNMQQTSMPGMAGTGVRPRPANSVVLQAGTGMPMNTMRHQIPAHGMPHQQMQPGGMPPVQPGVRPPIHNNPVHAQRHIRPPQPAPIRQHNPPPSSSNLISIPLQGSNPEPNNYNKWQAGSQSGQQHQWQNNSRVHTNIPSHQQYNS